MPGSEGTLAPGNRADLVRVDPDAIIYTLFAPSKCYPPRISHVVVNRQWVSGGNAFTGATPGRVLRQSV